MSIPRKYRRSLPFIKVLAKSKPRVNKVEILKKFPDYVTNDIIELLFNILTGNVPVRAAQRAALSKHRRAMHTFANLRNLSSRRNFVYKQKGGFITTILPLIAGLLSRL